MAHGSFLPTQTLTDWSALVEWSATQVERARSTRVAMAPVLGWFQSGAKGKPTDFEGPAF